GLPWLTRSPTLTWTPRTVPAEGVGTSRLALSVSRVISGSSTLTTSPALTSTSTMGTSVKSPMSGTVTLIVRVAIAMRVRSSSYSRLAASRVQLAWVDVILPKRVRHHRGRDCPLVGECFQRGDRDKVAIDLEE